MGGTADRVELRGLRLVCAVGVPDAERSRPQPVEVDLDVVVDASAAAAADDLADTVDYGAALDALAVVATGSAFRLLESLAEAMADAVLAQDRVGEVTVAVRKLQPPVPYDLATAGVRITRRRG